MLWLCEFCWKIYNVKFVPEAQKKFDNGKNWVGSIFFSSSDGNINICTAVALSFYSPRLWIISFTGHAVTFFIFMMGVCWVDITAHVSDGGRAGHSHANSESRNSNSLCHLPLSQLLRRSNKHLTATCGVPPHGGAIRHTVLLSVPGSLRWKFLHHDSLISGVRLENFPTGRSTQSKNRSL